MGGTSTDETISDVNAGGIEVQALSSAGRRTARALDGVEVSPGYWQIRCSSENEVLDAIETLNEAGFGLAPAARAGVARLATTALCRSFHDGALDTLAFGQGFMSLVHDLCAVKPLHDGYLELFRRVEQWEAAVGQQRADAEQQLRSLAQMMGET